MARSTATRIPADADLTWLLQSGEAALGRATAFREGGGGSFGDDHERRITDRRFSYYGVDAEVERARSLESRWQCLTPAHRAVLALAYGVSPDVYRAQIAGRNWEEKRGKRTVTGFDPGAYDLLTWQAMERAFGGLIGVALYLAPHAGEVARRRVDLEKGGAWTTPVGRALVALCVARGEGLIEAQVRVVAALTEALAAWWAVPRVKGERHVNVHLSTVGERRVA